MAMRIAPVALITALLLFPVAAPEFAAAQQRDARWGSINADLPSARGQRTPRLALGNVNHSRMFTNAMAVSGGVALRNRAGGAINISGVTGPVKRAYIYWSVIGNPLPDAAKSINIRRLLPTPATGLKNIVGTIVGTTAAPCEWDGEILTVFRGTVPKGVATGNGLYVVTLNPGAAGLTGGEDPWVSQTPPSWEGASLVFIGTGDGTVSLYDQGLSGNMFNDVLTYSLVLPTNVTSATTVLWHNIGADGQRGEESGFLPDHHMMKEFTTINGVRVAGPQADSHDSSWNGKSGLPLPQLWDNETHDITIAAKAGDGTHLNVKEVSSADCVAEVANVVAVH
jgi:hypothetical protein